MNKKINKERNKVIQEDKNKKKKKDVLKLLGMIGIDTRYISYTPNVIYINDQRFAKFSKRRQETFKKYYPEIDIISSTLFRKICIKFSEIMANEISPKSNVLILKPKNRVDYLLNIVLEPYTQKYGVNIIEYTIDNLEDIFNDDIINKNNLNSPHFLFSNYSKQLTVELANINNKEDVKLLNKEDISIKIDYIVTNLTLDEKVESILSSFFSGNGIPQNNEKNRKTKIVNPFINIPESWIDSFLDTVPSKISSKIDILDKKKEKNVSNDETSIKIADSFMGFIEDIIPQYKSNILKSSIFIEKELEKNKKLKS